MKKKFLFLGCNSRQTNLIKFVRDQGHEASHKSSEINLNYAKKFNFIISFGYKKILSEKLIKSLKKPILNLHIGYLPYNRGCHPNLWSFLDNTPSGITIHEIDKKIDRGKILFQEKVDFKDKDITLKQSYIILKRKIENLFIKKFNAILKGNYKKYPQRGISTFHNKKDKPNFINWNMKAINAQKKYDYHLKKEIEKNLKLIDDIQNVRKNNNINWMDILRVGITNVPIETKKIINKISFDDDKIGNLLRKVNK